MLVLAIGVALVWANARTQSYEDFWTSTFTIGFTDHHLSLTFREWVNDGLMAVFFFVVGLEIKRELVEGELREPRKAALPVVAALGGMAVPALVYLAFTAGGRGSNGWGIPMATDIAIAVGMLSLLGRRVAPQLKLFLLALAIVDDIGAIIVIALFYSSSFEWEPALGALGVITVMFVLRWLGVRSLLPYVVLGICVWLLVHESALHATLAGVVLGLLAPTRPFRHPDMVDADKLADVSTVRAAQESVVLARVGLCRRVARVPAAPVEQLLDRADLRARERRRGDQLGLDRRRCVVTRHARHRGGTRGRQAGGHHGRHVARLPIRIRCVARRHALAATSSASRRSAGSASRCRSSSRTSRSATTPTLASNAKLGILAATVVAALLGTAILLVPTRSRTRKSGPGTQEENR